MTQRVLALPPFLRGGFDFGKLLAFTEADLVLFEHRSRAVRDQHALMAVMCDAVSAKNRLAAANFHSADTVVVDICGCISRVS